MDWLHPYFIHNQIPDKKCHYYLSDTSSWTNSHNETLYNLPELWRVLNLCITKIQLAEPRKCCNKLVGQLSDTILSHTQRRQTGQVAKALWNRGEPVRIEVYESELFQCTKLVWEFGETVLGKMEPLKGDEVCERVRQKEKTVWANAQLLKPPKFPYVARQRIQLKTDQPQLRQWREITNLWWKHGCRHNRKQVGLWICDMIQYNKLMSSAYKMTGLIYQ